METFWAIVLLPFIIAGTIYELAHEGFLRGRTAGKIMLGYDQKTIALWQMGGHR